MNKWDKRFMELAKLVAGWSKDPSKKVGAVIVDETNIVVSLGYNGFPARLQDTTERLENVTLKNIFTIHAEDNALAMATKLGISKKCTLYVWPAFPCSDCAKRIIRAGFVEKIVTYHIDNGSSWQSSQETAFNMFIESGIDLEILPWVGLK